MLEHRQLDVASAIVEVQRAAYAIEAEIIGFNGIPPLHETVEQVAALDLTILGAFDGLALAGLVGYERDGDVVDIDRLAVAPQFFRHGVGRALVTAVHERESDAGTFTVSTGALNTPAIELYTRLGYRRLADRDLPEGLTIAVFKRSVTTPWRGASRH